MRLKKNKVQKSEKLVSRCTDHEKKQVQRKANIYTEGNVSEYILYASLNFVPSKEDFDDKEN